MASAKTIAWVERLVWILIYAGLFTAVLGIASLGASRAAAWSLIIVGGLLALAGAALIWVRSVLTEPH